MRASILFVLFFASAACAPSASAPVAERTPLPVTAAAIVPQGTELRLDIVQLTCHSCAGQVANGTSHIPGVLRVSAEMREHILIVRYDPTLLTAAALIDAIDKVVDAVVN